MTRRKIASPAPGSSRGSAGDPGATRAHETPETAVRKEEVEEKAAAESPRDIGEISREPEETPVMKAEEERPSEPVKARARPKPEAAAVKRAQRAPRFEDIGQFNRENAEAFMQTAAAMAKCCEALGVEWVEYAKSSVDHGVATSRDLMTCTCVEDALDVQNRFIKEMLDVYLTESTKMSEISLRMANEAMTPLNERFRAVVDTIQRPFAA